jgi:4-carboxymuconolactone decarboxylase
MPATDAPVLDLLKTMTAQSIEASTLDEESLMLVRIAALVAVDAPPSSYLLNIGAAGDVGIDAEHDWVTVPASVPVGKLAGIGFE